MSDPSTTRSSSLTAVIAKSTVLSNAKTSSNPLSAFCFFPTMVQFDIQHGSENILLLMRQHFIINTGWIILSVFLAFLPSLVGLFPFLAFLPPTYQHVLFLSWYVILFGFVLERFVVWYYNVYIITDERLIDIDFYSLLFKRVSEAKLDHVQDITGASGGVIQSLFDYGDVLIQTAAEIPEIQFEKVPHPDLVAKLVSELIDKEEVEARSGK